MNTPTDTTTMIYAMMLMKMKMMMMRAIATTTRSTPRTVSPRKTRTPCRPQKHPTVVVVVVVGKSQRARQQRAAKRFQKPFCFACKSVLLETSFSLSKTVFRV
jgi:hypothetical protein